MFSVEAIKNLRNSGSVVPSSRFLVDKMTRSINGEDHVIVEFGTGNGKITKNILQKKSLRSKLISFELNPSMHEKAQLKLPEDDKFWLINGSAFAFDQFLEQHQIEKVDQFISSLPLSLLNENDIENLLAKVKAHLHPQGVFIQYQYSLDKYDLLRSHFKEVKLSFTPLNFPPAFVYRCSI